MSCPENANKSAWRRLTIFASTGLAWKTSRSLSIKGMPTSKWASAAPYEETIEAIARVRDRSVASFRLAAPARLD